MNKFDLNMKNSEGKNPLSFDTVLILDNILNTVLTDPTDSLYVCRKGKTLSTLSGRYGREYIVQNAV